MKTNVLVSLILCTLTLLIGCTEIFEPNLEAEQIVLFTPKANAILNDQEVFISWDELDNALEYQLQIARPSFEDANFFLLDTFVTGLNLKVNLSDGDYECRVRAHQMNNSSNYTYRSFTINSISSFPNLRPFVSQPLYDDTTAALAYQFAWFSLENNAKYIAQVRSLDFNQLLRTDTLSDTNYEFSFPGEGAYQIQIVGLKNGEVSLPALRKVLIDQTSPMPSVLTSPRNGDSINVMPIQFQWHKDPQEISSISDSIRIELETSSGTFVNEYIINGNSFSYFLNSSGSLKVFIKSIDKATNSSSWSDPYQFYYEQ